MFRLLQTSSALLVFDFLSTLPIPVRSRVAYPSWDYRQTSFREEDYVAHFFVHAVKNDKQKIANKVKDLKIGPGGAAVRISGQNLDVARSYFGQWAAEETRKAGIGDPVFVPIPNRDGLADAQDFNSAFLAREAARHFGQGANAFTGLRFRTHVPKGGARQSVSQLIENMAIVGDVPAGTIVLVDDVYTLGQHISAAVRKLPRRPALVTVAGRTLKEPIDGMTSPQDVSHHC